MSSQWRRLVCWMSHHEWAPPRTVNHFFDPKKWENGRPIRGYTVFHRVCSACNAVQVDVHSWPIPMAWDNRNGMAYPLYGHEWLPNLSTDALKETPDATQPD
jgi:hypothetical protein